MTGDPGLGDGGRCRTLERDLPPIRDQVGAQLKPEVSEHSRVLARARPSTRLMAAPARLGSAATGGAIIASARLTAPTTTADALMELMTTSSPPWRARRTMCPGELQGLERHEDTPSAAA
ncbi:MAG: hypothetical protein U0904_01515 [Candidatus Nanopelagicales bacterium]|nr:hypothetical protein [Candidatus Nanopelagicales bacterium]